MAHTIALHLPSAEQRTHVVAALSRAAVRISVCGSQESAITSFRATSAPDLYLTALRDAAGHSVAPFLQAFHFAFPRVVVVAYGSLSPQFARDLLSTASNVTEVTLHGYDDLPALVARLLNRTTGRHVADLALAAVDGRLSRVTRPVVGYCLASAHAPQTVERVASAFGVRRKTVASWLRADELPPASTVIGWGRVLLAARYLEDVDRSVERVALGLGFDSGSALRHMLARYTRLRATEIRARGGFAGVLPLFTSALARPTPPRLACGDVTSSGVT